MALFDFFKKKKKKKKEEEAKKETRKEVLPERREEIKRKIGSKESVEALKPRKKTLGRSYRVLATPQVTEKATRLGEENKYVFKVLPRANKAEIKKAIEQVYGVDVTGVRIINIPRKQRRLGKYKGWKKGYKKAIVKIKKGQKIEILPR